MSIGLMHNFIDLGCILVFKLIFLPLPQCLGSGSAKIWIRGAKYQPKTEEKKILLSKLKSEQLKKARF